MRGPFYENLDSSTNSKIILQSRNQNPDLKINFIELIKNVPEMQPVVFIFKNIYRSLTMLITITNQIIPRVISIIDALSSSCKCFCVKLNQFVSEYNQINIDVIFQNTRLYYDDFNIKFIPEISCICSFYERVINKESSLVIPDILNNKRMKIELFKNQENGKIVGNANLSNGEKINVCKHFSDEKFPSQESEIFEMLLKLPFKL